MNNLVSPKLPEPENAFLDSPFVHSHLLMPQSVSIDVKVFVKYFCKARKGFKFKYSRTLRYLVGDLVELVSEELNHFGLIAGLFRQIRGHTG